MKRDVRFPGLRHGTHDDFAVGPFRQGSPAERSHGREETPGGRIVGRRAKQQLPRPEDDSREWQVKQVLFGGGSKRNGCRRFDANAMTLHDVIGGHERVEELVELIPSRLRRTSVAVPRETRKGRVPTRSSTDAKGEHTKCDTQ